MHISACVFVVQELDGVDIKPKNGFHHLDEDHTGSSSPNSNGEKVTTEQPPKGHCIHLPKRRRFKTFRCAAFRNQIWLNAFQKCE